ncbi:MAG: hypothetical protein O3B84_00895 [Chloroflexi bacterium]|nr:hypothetical protein [Chloroflexota bacterium]
MTQRPGSLNPLRNLLPNLMSSSAVIVAAFSGLLGWGTIAAITVWYWRTVVPDMYDDESVLPYIAGATITSLAYLAVVVGAWRRFSGHRDGMPVMISGAFVIFSIFIGSIATTGLLLVPSWIIAMLAPALPAGGKGRGTGAG